MWRYAGGALMVLRCKRQQPTGCRAPRVRCAPAAGRRCRFAWRTCVRAWRVAAPCCAAAAAAAGTPSGRKREFVGSGKGSLENLRNCEHGEQLGDGSVVAGAAGGQRQAAAAAGGSGGGDIRQRWRVQPVLQLHNVGGLPRQFAAVTLADMAVCASLPRLTHGSDKRLNLAAA